MISPLCVSLQYPINGSTSGDRNSEGRALYQNWSDTDSSPVSSVLGLC